MPTKQLNIQDLEERIGIIFQNKDVAIQSLTHSSYSNEHRGQVEDNERLEFLGDAVLQLVATDFLYKLYPEMAEGELTTIRSAMVSRKTLGDIAKSLHLGDFLRLSQGEERSGGRTKDVILANTIEAILGAVYFDQGYEQAKKFVETHILAHLDRILQEEGHVDPKSRLQELAQERDKITPNYTVVMEEGPDHKKIFTVVVCLGDEELAQGKGSSKQKAEEDAAKNALLTY